MNVNKKLLINDTKIKGYWWFISLSTIIVKLIFDHLTKKKKEDKSTGRKLDQYHFKPCYNYRELEKEATSHQASHYRKIILPMEKSRCTWFEQTMKDAPQ